VALLTTVCGITERLGN